MILGNDSPILNLYSISIVCTPLPPPPPTFLGFFLGGGGGGELNHFSERSYRRDLGQTGILGGNWHFRWGGFLKNSEYEK